jgi:hypothetical protein
MIPDVDAVMAMTIEEARVRVESILTSDMIESLEAVEYELPPFSSAPRATTLADAKRGRVAIRHVKGAADAHYLVEAYGDALLMQLQLNLWRMVVVFRVPAADALDATSLGARLERWRIGAEHAGWKIGFRDAFEPPRRWVDTYAYAMGPEDLLENELQLQYWRTDIVEMTRYFMLEMRRCGVRLSPADAGYAI